MAEGEALRWVQAWMDEGEEEYRRCTGPGRGRGGGACLGKGCTVVDQEVWGVCE
jgi:hypothetical protein